MPRTPMRMPKTPRPKPIGIKPLQPQFRTWFAAPKAVTRITVTLHKDGKGQSVLIEDPALIRKFVDTFPELQDGA